MAGRAARTRGGPRASRRAPSSGAPRRGVRRSAAPARSGRHGAISASRSSTVPLPALIQVLSFSSRSLTALSSASARSRPPLAARTMRLSPSGRRSRWNHFLAAPARSVAAHVTGNPTSAGPTAPEISQASSGTTTEASGRSRARARDLRHRIAPWGAAEVEVIPPTFGKKILIYSERSVVLRPADGRDERPAGPAGVVLRAVHRVPAAACMPAAAIRWRSAFSPATKISEKVGNGWMTSRSTASGTCALTASTACCIHSPASGPSA